MAFIGNIFGFHKTGRIEAQRLGEISEQTAKEGEARPIIWGIARPIKGNIIFMSKPIKEMVKTYVGSGGKGGRKKQYQDVEHVYRYYAIRVCEGPITGFRRIWRNNKLVYDARKGSSWGQNNNAAFLKIAKLYTGGWDQMPDPSIESFKGVGNVPAFRGTAYIVVNKEDLTELGGAVPQYTFEVVRKYGEIITSRPYELYDNEAITTDIRTASLKQVWPPYFEDHLIPRIGISSIEKKRVVQYSEYDAPVEDYLTPAISIVSIDKKRVVRYSSYSAKPESIQSSISVSSILKKRVVGYVDYKIPQEYIEPDIAITSIKKERV